MPRGPGGSIGGPAALTVAVVAGVIVLGLTLSPSAGEDGGPTATAGGDDRSASSGANPPSGAAPSPTAGFPRASTTGVPDGVSLTSRGDVTITQDGSLLQGVELGCVTVSADDVVIREARITCGRESPSVLNEGSNLLLEDVEIDGRNRGEVGIGYGDYTVRRVDIHGTVDGAKAESNTTIEDSYIHHLARKPGSHGDAIQTSEGSDIRIVGNNLQAYNPDRDDPMNAAWMASETFGPVSDVVFARNLVNGGNYTVYGAGSVVIRDNVFGRDMRYGPVNLEPGVTFTRSNVWADTGRPVG